MPFPTVEEEGYDRLHRAGWSLGIYSLAGPHGVVYVVEGVNGENVIRGEGDTSDAAYLSACDQARVVGMFGRQQERQVERRR
jgi:hypothetical protein